jgi:outer membrane protein
MNPLDHNRTQMTQMVMINTDKISENLSNQRYQCSVGIIKLLPLLLLFVQSAYAGDTAKLRFITMDSAVAMGIKHSHTIAMSIAQVSQSQAALDEVKDLIMPNVDASAGYSRLSNIPTEYFSFPGFPGKIPSTALFPVILNNYSLGASASESVFNGFQWKNGVVSLDYAEKASEYSLESKKGDVSISIINAYLSLFKLEKAHVLIEESLDEIKAHVKEVNDFASHGLATENDVLRTQLQQSNTELSEIDVRNQIQTVNYNLDILLGLPENTKIQIDTVTILADKTMQPLPFYLQKYGNDRYDIKAAEMQEKAQEAGIKVTESGVYPKLLVGADYNYLRPNPRIVPPLDAFEPSWDIGVKLTYSLTGLYDNKHKMQESRAKYTIAEETYNQLNDGAKMEINQDYLQYQEALQKIAVSQKSLDQANENYRTVKSRYTNHVALLTDLLDANNFLLNAQINIISAKADAQMAYYNLLKAAGELTSTPKK